MFILQFGQNGLKHSWFFLVTHTLHTGQFRTFSQTILPPSLFVLCFSKHARLLKFLLQDSHGTLSSANVHGGIDLQSLHVLRTYASRHVHILYYSLCIHAFALRTRKIVYHVVMSLYIIIHQVNSFLRFPCPSKYMSSQFNPPKTRIPYSLKCSWIFISSGTPPPRDRSIPCRFE